MNQDNERNYVRIKKATLFVAILVLAAGLLGWWLGRSEFSFHEQMAEIYALKGRN